MTASGSCPADRAESSAWRTTGSVGVVSSASSAGRWSTRAPAARATSVISASSVDTTTSRSCRAATACSTVQASSGLPATSRRFLRGTPLEPPRAGMTQRILTRSSSPAAPPPPHVRGRRGAVRGTRSAALPTVRGGSAPRTPRPTAAGRAGTPSRGPRGGGLEHPGGEDADHRATELAQGAWGAVDGDAGTLPAAVGRPGATVHLGGVRPVARAGAAAEALGGALEDGPGQLGAVELPEEDRRDALGDVGARALGGVPQQLRPDDPGGDVLPPRPPEVPVGLAPGEQGRPGRRAAGRGASAGRAGR